MKTKNKIPAFASATCAATLKGAVVALCLAFCSAVAQTPNYVPANGLVGYWPLDNTGHDLSVNLNHGTVMGATPVSDRFNMANHAYSFNGTNNYIVVPDNITLSGFADLTISAWIKANTYNGEQAIVAKWYQALNCNGNSDTYIAHIQNGYMQFVTNFNNTTGIVPRPAFTASDLNTWRHFVFVFTNASSINVYMDGALVHTSATNATSVCHSTNNLLFGADVTGSGGQFYRYFDGAIDDIGIWHRALSLCEIKQLYTASVMSLSAVSSNTQGCAGTPITLTGSGASTYSWSNGSTGASIVVSPVTTTTYTVIGTNTLTHCSDTLTIVQRVTACDAINKLLPGDAITIYPNPTKGTVFINGLDEPFYVEVTNILGELLYNGLVNHKAEIDLGSRNHGLYLIKITTQNGSVIKKIIKE